MMKKTQKLATLAVIAVLLLLAGCAELDTSPLTPTSTATPSLMPQATAPAAADATSLDGTWVGITPQNKPITITVESGELVSFQFGIEVAGPGWTATSELHVPAGAEIEDGAVSVEYDTVDWYVDFKGAFKGLALEGEMVVEHHHPQGMGTARVEMPISVSRLLPGESVDL